MPSLDSVVHIVATRLRVVGSGNLDLTVSDLDDVASFPLLAIAMAATTNVEPTRISNFQSQKIRLNGSVNVINEYFVIKRIIMFIKPVAVEFPM